MSNSLLRSMDLARYQRWLDRAIDGQAAFMVLDVDGSVIWGQGHSEAVELGRALGANDDADQGVHRLSLNSHRTALYRSVTLAGVGRVGWSAIVVDLLNESDTPISIDHMVEAFDDLTTGMTDECRQKHDLESMTEELGSRYEELHLVYAVDHHVQAHARRHDVAFHNLLQAAAEHLDADVVAYVRPSKNICQYATSLSKEIHNLDLVLVEMRGDLFRFIQTSGESAVINDPADPRRAYIFTDMPYKVMACPVHQEQRVDSLVVLLNHSHKRDFSNSDRKLVEVLAHQLSSLSNTHLLLESMREFNQQLAMTLIEAVEAKDPYTRGHSDRVHHFSMEIGKAMGLPADDLDDLYWGSLLHDVGKIGIPDHLLLKPGTLSAAEYEQIKPHAAIGAGMVSDLLSPEQVSWIRHHHESFDGAGYPDGLAGSDIPDGARILAVADTWDAMMVARPYGVPRTKVDALAECRRNAGSQLCPDAVASLVSFLESGTRAALAA